MRKRGIDQPNRSLGAEAGGHLPKGASVEFPGSQQPCERRYEIAARCPRLFGVLEEVDDEPFGRRRCRKRYPAEAKAAAAELERPRTLRVVDEALGRECRRSESKGVPALGAGKNKWGVVQERPHELVVGGRNGSETGLLGVCEETMGQTNEFPIAGETFGEAGRIGTPTGELTGAIDPARLQRWMSRPNRVPARQSIRLEALNLIESTRFPPVTSTDGIDKIKLSAKFGDAVHPLVECNPMPFGKVVELLRDISLQLVVGTVANPRKHDRLPRREGHAAQTELAVIGTAGLDFDRPAPTHDDDGLASVLNHFRREKGGESLFHQRGPGPPEARLRHRRPGGVGQIRAKDDIGAELALHRLGKIVIATEELGNEVLFGRLGARGLQRIPSKGNDPMDVERLGPLFETASDPGFPAPGRGREVVARSMVSVGRSQEE